MSATLTVEDLTPDEEAALHDLARVIAHWRRAGRWVVRTAKFSLPLAIFIYYVLAIWQKLIGLPVHLPLWWRWW